MGGGLGIIVTGIAAYFTKETHQLAPNLDLDKAGTDAMIEGLIKQR